MIIKNVWEYNDVKPGGTVSIFGQGRYMIIQHNFGDGRGMFLNLISLNTGETQLDFKRQSEMVDWLTEHNASLAQ